MKLYKEKEKHDFLIISKASKNVYGYNPYKLWLWNSLSNDFDLPFERNPREKRFIIVLEDKIIYHDAVNYYDSNILCSYYISNKDLVEFEDKVSFRITDFEMIDGYLMINTETTTGSFNPLTNHIKWSISSVGNYFNCPYDTFLIRHRDKPIIECIDKETGKSHWGVDLTVYMQPNTMETPDLEQAFYDAQSDAWILSISGIILAIDAATGQVKWDKVGFPFARYYEYDATTGKLYFFEHTSKHREQIVYYYEIDLENGDMSMIREHTPITMSIHKLLPKIKKGSETNISFVRIICVREGAIYFAIRNLGLLYKADKTTGEILTTYNHKQPFRDGLIHDNYLFMPEYRKKAEENGVLIFEL